MTPADQTPLPDNTAARTALWRALHVQTDAAPVILNDTLGMQLLAPEAGWQQRPDMHPDFTKRLRASVVARARFIEDLALAENKKGITQYVLLGAGLDTFAQRNTEAASEMDIYEIDRPETLAWKQQRLIALGLGISPHLHFVPVDFEQDSWWEELLRAGFDPQQPALVTCTGVSLYLSTEAIQAMLGQLAAFAPGSSFAISFYLPFELLDEADKPLQLLAEKGAQASGTPFVSFFNTGKVIEMAEAAGLKKIGITSTQDMQDRYFANRIDGLTPASGEFFLTAHT